MIRLSTAQQHHLHAVFTRYLPRGARAWLFGSRVQPEARGGDLDLLIALPTTLNDPPALVRRLRIALQQRLGERKIDILLEAPNLPRSALHEIAREEGVLLWTNDSGDAPISTNN